MDDMLAAVFSAFARWRSIRDLGATRANFVTLSGYLQLPDLDLTTVVAGLAGGGLGRGSTCGVVTGACIAIAAAHLADIVSDRGKGEDLYGRMHQFTGWFEESFGSTLCNELCGEEMAKSSSIMAWLLKGKALSTCCYLVGRADAKAVELMDLPLERKKPSLVDRRLTASGGYCAADVLAGVRSDTGYGSLYLEHLSMALDGGVGLSGGLCGALAGSILPLALIDGVNRSFLFRMAPFKDKTSVWSAGNRLMAEFKQRFGSLQCGYLTGCSFTGGIELAAHIGKSQDCAEIKDWCRMQVSQLILSGLRFN